MAVLRLHEAGVLALDQPVADILPHFAPRVVLLSSGMEPVRGLITIRHLLTHTSGLGYGKVVSTSNDVVDDMYHRARLLDRHNSWALLSKDLRNVTSDIGCMPLKFQPGEGFEYALGHIVLGDVIETVCNQQLSAALQTLVFDPLDIHSAMFAKPPDISLDETNPSTRPASFAIEQDGLELGDSGLVMTVRDLHTLVSSINTHDKENDTRLLSLDTLAHALSPHFSKCSKINEIATTPLKAFDVVTNWSLLGPLRHDKLFTNGAFGVCTFVDKHDRVTVVVKDQMLVFWDLEQLVSELLDPASVRSVPNS